MKQLITIILLSLFWSNTLGQCTDTVPQIWVKKTLQDTSLSKDTIYHQGAPDSTRTTVVLRAWASACSTITGHPIDVLFACDLSGSMFEQSTSGRRRITWAQISSLRFIDSLNKGYDRLAILGWAGNTMTINDTGNTAKYRKTVFPISTNLDAAKSFVGDSLYCRRYTNTPVYYNGDTLWAGRNWYPDISGTPLKISINVGLKYLRTNADSTNSPVMILLTDGESNGESGISDAQSIALADSFYHSYGIRTYAIGFNGGNINFLRNLTSWNGVSHAYDATTPTQLDSVFQLILLQLSDVAAVSLSPGTPMLLEALGPGIHYVQGSYTARSGTGFQVPSLQVDSVTFPGRAALKFIIDTVRVGKFLELKYDITAVSKNFTDTWMRINNNYGDTISDNFKQISLVQYKNAKAVTVTKPIEDRNMVLVKSSIGGLFLSKSPLTLDSPSPTKQISRTFTYTTPAVYEDTMMYALLLQRATDTSAYFTVNNALWNFQPNPNWTGTPPLINYQGSSHIIGITVPYNYADSRTLRLQDTVRGHQYRDSLTFNFSDASLPSAIVSIGIDEDTTSPKTFSSRIVLTGNKTQLNTTLRTLYARGLSNRDSIRGINATWSSSGFTLYATQFATLFSGNASRKTLALTVKDTTFAQTDSGLIGIDTAGLSYSLRLVIRDTTDYDTTKLTCIYNNNYSGNAAQIEAAYPVQSDQRYFTPSLNDTLTFWAMAFDSNSNGIKYLGGKSVSWQLNNNTPTTSLTFGLRRTTALQSDRLIISYVNEWGVTLKDTVDIYWGFGKKRFLKLESQAGTYGTADSFPVTTITVPNTADTVRGFYAVIRDEYGYCVETGQSGTYAVWAFNNSGASTYLTNPSDSASAGWVFRKSSPINPLSFYLTAYGLPIDAAYQVDRDSIEVRLVNYAYSKLDIFTTQPIQGFNSGDTIPRSTILNLRCDLSGHFQAKALHDGSLYDVVTAEWSLIDGFNPFDAGALPFTASDITLSPVRRTTYPIRLMAQYFNGATTLRDTITLMVEPPVVTTLVLDSSKTLNNNLSVINITGNLTQLRNTYFWLYANAGYSCSGEPGSCLSVNWSATSTPNAPWFQNMVTGTACSLYVDFQTIPLSVGSHSMTGTISIQYGSSFSDRITLNIQDTTDYDSLRYFVVDTTRYSGNDYPYANIQTLLDKKQPNLVYTYQAGQTAHFYPLLFDLKAANGGGAIPKLIGTDNTQWELHRGATGTVTTSETASFSYSSTVAHVSDTLIIRYPAATRLLSDSAYPPKNFTGTQTIILRWTPGNETRLRLVDVDNPYTGSHLTDTLSMPLGVDSVKAYAFLFDQFGNYLFNNAASMTNAVTWTSSSPLYFGVPGTPTHIGNLHRTTSRPENTAVYRVIVTLPESTYLGDRSAPSPAATDTVYVRMGSFTYDSIRIVTNNNSHDFFTTTHDTIEANNGTVSSYDTLILHACEDTARFFARVHNTDSAAGWQTVPIAWTYNGVRSTPIIIPGAGATQGTLVASYFFQDTLSDTIHFQIEGEYLERLYLTPSTRRITLSINTTPASPDTSLALIAHARSNCGGALDSSVLWSISGFSNPLWRDSLAFYLSAAQSSKILHPDFINAAYFNQSDSGYIFIRKFDPIHHDTLRDSIKLVLIDTTDYDTVKGMVIVPDSVYRAADNKNTLYDLYDNRPLNALYSGDSLSLTALLFDFKASGGDKFLGTGQIPGTDANIFWYLNDTLKKVDSVFAYLRNAPRMDTLVVVYRNSTNDTLSIKTFYLNWGFGKQRILRIESTRGTTSNTAIQGVDTLVFGLSKTVDTVFSVIRDELGNFISNEPLKWSMTSLGGAPSYVTYLDVTNPQIPTSTGWIRKKTPPPAEYTYQYSVALPKGVTIAGITTLVETRDSIHVLLTNYSFDAINIYADVSKTPITDTSKNIYITDSDIPKSATLFLTALQDTITLKARVHRDDGSAIPWISQPVDWTLTNPSCVASAVFGRSTNATLMPISNLNRDTLVASYRVSGSLTLYDTVYFTVDLPYIASIRVTIDSTRLKAGDTTYFTIELLDKNGNRVTNEGRVPGNLTLTTNTQMLFLGSNYSQWINNTSYVVNNPFENGMTHGGLVNYYASNNNQIIIGITYETGSGPVTFLDTLTLHILPAAPDSMVVIREAKNAPAKLDTLTAYQDNLIYASLSYRIELYDTYGNLIPTGDSAYKPLTITRLGNVLDHDFATIAYNLIRYEASGRENGGMATVNITYPRAGTDTLKYSFNILVIPVIRVTSVSTHEWIADPVNQKAEVEFVMSRVLNLNLNKLLAGRTNPDTIARLYLDTLAYFGFKPYRDGYLDYLDFRLSEPFYMTEDVIHRIAFDTLVDGVSDTIVWKLDTLGRTIRLQAIDSLSNDSNHIAWRLWLIPHTLDIGFSSTLETGLLPNITFNNLAIHERDLRKTIYPHIGSGASLYTTPDILTLDSAGPVVAKFVLQNNACNPDNPENSVHISFSEPIRYTDFPLLADIQGLVIKNPENPDADSLFLTRDIISGIRKERVFNPVVAWNYNKEPDRMMTYELVIKQSANNRFRANATQIRFANLNPLLSEFFDLSGNAGTLGPNRYTMLINDPTKTTHICGVNGNTLVSNTASMDFSWGTAPGKDGSTQEEVPLFPYFGVTINLLAITSTNKIPDTILIPSTSIGGRCFMVADFLPSYVLYSTDVTIFDLLGNLVATPTTNKGLKNDYTVAQIRKFKHMDEIDRRLESMTLEEIENYYTIHPGPACDTLRPVYPGTITLGYEFMKENCGPENTSSREMCVTAWNCLNSKGRLVAPGGYIAHQNIRAGGENSKVTRKIVVTNKPK